MMDLKDEASFLGHELLLISELSIYLKEVNMFVLVFVYTYACVLCGVCEIRK